MVPRVPATDPMGDHPKDKSIRSPRVRSDNTQWKSDGASVMVYFDMEHKSFTYHKGRAAHGSKMDPCLRFPTEMESFDAIGQDEIPVQVPTMWTRDQDFHVHPQPKKMMRLMGWVMIRAPPALGSGNQHGGGWLHLAACWGVYNPLSGCVRSDHAPFLLPRRVTKRV